MRLTLIDLAGQIIKLEDLKSAADLRAVQDQARIVIRDAERLLEKLNPKKAGAGIPYR
jgi:predicted NBD/HSP70 family sugar kinase